MPSGSRLRRMRPLIALGTVVLVVGLGVTTAVALGSSSGHAYRTATVTRGTVAQLLHGTGTIQPVSQASVAFPIAGVVATVAVTPGTEVTAGQTLATLDATSLQQAVVAKQAALAAANLTLYKALNGQSSGSNGAAGAGNTNTAVGSGAPQPSADTSAAQQQLLAAQKTVDDSMATAQASLQAASEACGTSTPTTPHSPRKPPTGPSSPGTASPGTASPGTASPGTTGAAPSPTSTTSTITPVASKPATTGLGTLACLAAQQTLSTDQQALSTAQQALARSEQSFERLLTSSATAAGSSRAASSSSSSSSSATSAPSAAQLVADQSAVDAAATDVLAAQESVAQATITSPITGTVAAVGIQVGHSVTASSTTSAVVVSGGGGYEISTTVSVNDIAKLKVGDAATVVPDATSRTLNGKVVWVGAASGSSTSTSYPVVIGLTGSPS
ncbi:MAG: trimeric autotransporter adhesin, partial [Actinomycetota bacterium]|nr:trimeric autotransporter adhesin [Actinomycetota bacterium]